MTGLAQVELLATVILGLAFLAARGLREAYRAVEDPTSRRPSVHDWWQARFPAGRTRPPLRLVEGDR